MNNSKTKRTAEVLIGVYAFLISVFGGYFVSDFFVAPITDLQLVVDNPDHLVAGQNMVFHITYNRTKICSSHASRFIVDPPNDAPTRAIRYREEIPLPILMDRNTGTGKIKLPDDLDGDYIFQIYISNACSLITRVDEYNEVNIHVNPKK